MEQNFSFHSLQFDKGALKELPNPNPVWSNNKMETIQENQSKNTKLNWK